MERIKENSTNNHNRKFLTTCDMTYAIQLIGGRWKLLILTHLSKGKLRFGELNKKIPHITERMLTLQLKEMAEDNLITRKVYAEVPPKVEYELTVLGTELIPVCLQLSDWGTKHRAATSIG
ncbi:transcriptional regulator [Pedobacter frigiditerrae]|uniref:Transcriptional regulator n=2 Tax=Pedobacter frigiditerrae TaxID=2530452 RepID=A0A4R0MN89_9SPHI|nr:transcriptional regulator [Pedobacter frigiditerrae]